MSDWVEHPRYVQYYRALLYHGDYVAWNEGDTWYFMRDGKKCVFYKEDE
ncbi:MAG: hypothetical protein JXA07_04005 [Spirochaetes bacterium]|nr:hypothetical protein [Spirochaetota bacterium]